MINQKCRMRFVYYLEVHFREKILDQLLMYQHITYSRGHEAPGQFVDNRKLFVSC